MLVPKQYSFETERETVTKLGTQNADRVSVFSFSFLADFLIKKYGRADLPQIDDSTRAVLMSLALEQISHKLDLYSKSKFSSGIISDMLGIVKELHQCSISPQQLLLSSEMLDDGILKSKLYELSVISKAYEALVERSFVDDETSLDKLHSLFPEIPWIDGKTVFVDGFRSFSAQEYKILGDILKRAKDVYITACVDKISTDGEKNSVFAYTRDTAKKLISLNERCSLPPVKIIKTQKDGYYSSKELNHLEGQLYSIVPEKYQAQVNDIEICAGENFIAECDYVAARVKKLICENGYRCRDIAIISRNEDEYEFQIKSSLKKFDLPVYIDKRQPIITQPLINFVSAAIKIACDGFTIESVMRLLKTELTNIERQEIARLENYAVMWKINGSRWCEDFKGHPNGLGFEMLERHMEELEQINKTRRSVSVPLAKFKKTFADIDGESGAKAIYDLLCDFNASKNLKALSTRLLENGETDLALEQGRIWDILMSILDNIAIALKGVKLTPKRFYELFLTMLTRFSIGVLPSGLDEVLIGSAQRVLMSSPKVIFAVGVNDGVFPYVEISKKVFSRNERELLKSVNIDLGESSRQDIMQERFIAYKTLCGATEKVYLSYSYKSLTGADLSPSELISQVKKIFPKVKIYDTALIEKQEYLRSDRACFEIMAREWRHNDSLGETLKKYFSENPQYTHRLAALKRAADKKQFQISDREIATLLFGKDMYMSATRVESYFKCPFSYFCKYGLDLKPQQIAELDPMQKGTVIHYVLENLIKKYGSKKLCQMSEDEIDEVVLSLLNEYFSLNMSASQEYTQRFNYLYTDLGRTVCAVAKRLVKEFSVSDFVPVDFELPIDNDSEVKPMEIELSDAGSIKIKGSVDRVDMMCLDGKSYVRVVDYKSGGKNFQLSDVFYGLNMQMLIYLFSIWKNGSGKYANVSPAGILYMPVKATVTDLGRNASDDEVLEKQMLDCKMNGMILDDSRVIIGMDNQKSGMFIPVKYDEKECVFKGNLIGLKEMELLSDRVSEILRDMGDLLHGGEIKAQPVFSLSASSAYQDACRFCDYKSVCGFEPDDERTQIQQMSHDDSILLMKGGEE